MCLVPAVRQAHNLVVTFQLPSQSGRYLAKADEYLSCLVGHEGRGSLLSLLKAKGWALALSAGVPEGGFERNTALYLFDVTVTLTEAGLAAEPGAHLKSCPTDTNLLQLQCNSSGSANGSTSNSVNQIHDGDHALPRSRFALCLRLSQVTLTYLVGDPQKDSSLCRNGLGSREASV